MFVSIDIYVHIIFYILYLAQYRWKKSSEPIWPYQLVGLIQGMSKLSCVQYFQSVGAQNREKKIERDSSANWIISPSRGEHKNCLKPPAGVVWYFSYTSQSEPVLTAVSKVWYSHHKLLKVQAGMGR